MNRTTLILGTVAASAWPALAGEPGPIFDPYGDAIAVFGDESPLIDIESLDVRYDATEVRVSMTFFTPISAPSADRLNSIAGFIEMDVDQNTATGVPALQNLYSPPFAPVELGTDFYCDLFTEVTHPGYVDILIDPGFAPVATVPITFHDLGLEFAIPKAALGDDGLLDFSAIIGTLAQPTDAMAVVGQSVPAPASLALAAAAGLVGTRRRR